jgi:hypothetical protein
MRERLKLELIFSRAVQMLVFLLALDGNGESFTKKTVLLGCVFFNTFKQGKAIKEII